MDTPKWRPTSGENIKINFDVTFDRLHFRSGLGLVAVNAQGQVVASRSVVQENVATTFVTEALACLEAVKLGLYLSFTNVTIE